MLPAATSLPLLIAFSTILGGKSSVLLDVKPWDDETDMKKLEEAVRSVEMPGLFWGACMCFYLLSTYFTNFIYNRHDLNNI